MHEIQKESSDLGEWGCGGRGLGGAAHIAGDTAAFVRHEAAIPPLWGF